MRTTAGVEGVAGCSIADAGAPEVLGVAPGFVALGGRFSGATAGDEDAAPAAPEIAAVGPAVVPGGT
jgi:hypothetical protein